MISLVIGAGEKVRLQACWANGSAAGVGEWTCVPSGPTLSNKVLVTDVDTGLSGSEATFTTKTKGTYTVKSMLPMVDGQIRRSLFYITVEDDKQP